MRRIPEGARIIKPATQESVKPSPPRFTAEQKTLPARAVRIFYRSARTAWNGHVKSLFSWQIFRLRGRARKLHFALRNLNLIKRKQILRKLKSWVAAAAMAALSVTAQAALVVQANGLEVLDTNTNLIWLRDWGVNGQQKWVDQKAWVDTLDGFAGSNDWRLPELGEYAALYAAYGDLTLVAAFTNVENFYYWSGTEYERIPGYASWVFNTVDGSQTSLVQHESLHAVAVRSADVVASVPEPQSLALALLALGATAVARKRRPA